jgi:hypothetical protein
MPGLLRGETRGRELAQLVVDEWQELLGGLRVTPLRGGEDAGDLAHSLEDTRRGRG